jgi:general secretion pathway protein G
MSRKIRRRPVRSAFTLLEVMLVLVIIAAIAGIAVYNIGGIQNTAQKRVAKSQISVFKQSLEQYRLLNGGSYPATLEELHSPPSGADNSDFTQILKDEIPKDPWNRPYEYTLNGNAYEIRSAGPDGQPGTPDDITS